MDGLSPGGSRHSPLSIEKTEGADNIKSLSADRPPKAYKQVLQKKIQNCFTGKTLMAHKEDLRTSEMLYRKCCIGMLYRKCVIGNVVSKMLYGKCCIGNAESKIL